MGPPVIDADRDKLIKCLRMFSSNFDGEVASAARRAHELIVSRSLDWDDLIIKPGRRHEQESQRRHHSGGTLDDIRHCQSLAEHLTEWEISFVNSIAGSILGWGRLTPKQQTTLDRIVNKMKLAGLWEGEPW
jgi:hypothetical protein